MNGLLVWLQVYDMYRSDGTKGKLVSYVTPTAPGKYADTTSVAEANGAWLLTYV